MFALVELQQLFPSKRLGVRGLSRLELEAFAAENLQSCPRLWLGEVRKIVSLLKRYQSSSNMKQAVELTIDSKARRSVNHN